MIDMKMIEQLRNFGEIKHILGEQENEFVKWVMRIGESRNILNNALLEFKAILDVMRELEHNIPQFHKQPGNFRAMEGHIYQITHVIELVNRKLSYVEEDERKTSPFICSVCGDEESDDNDE